MSTATAKLAHASGRSPYKGADSSTMRLPSFAARSFSFTSLSSFSSPCSLFLPSSSAEKVSGNMEKKIGCQQKRTQPELTCVLFLTQMLRRDSTPDAPGIVPESCGYSRPFQGGQRVQRAPAPTGADSPNASIFPRVHTALCVLILNSKTQTCLMYSQSQFDMRHSVRV